MKISLLCLPLLLLIAALPAGGQDVSSPFISLKFGGTVQARTSFYNVAVTPELSRTPDQDPETSVDEGLGFALRRVRLRMDASVGERLGAYVNLGAAGGRVELLDAFASYALTKAFKIRIGRLGSAQPGGKITSHTLIDGFERPYIVRAWEDGTRGGSGRTLGADLHYETDRVEAMLFFHNGGADNFRPEIQPDLYLYADYGTGMAVSGYASFRPADAQGLELGGYAEYNTAETVATSFICVPNIVCDDPRTYVSYAAHAYWGERPGSRQFRAKLDVISVDYEDYVRGVGSSERTIDQHTFGFSLLGAARVINAVEAYVRFEQYDDGLDDFYVYTTPSGDILDVERGPHRILSVGVNFSPSALLGRPYRQARLTLGYSTALNRPIEDVGLGVDEHLIVLQAQLVF